jgi:hypothetical protein
MNKGYNKNITENNITQSVFFYNIYTDPLDDLLEKMNKDTLKYFLDKKTDLMNFIQ